MVVEISYAELRFEREVVFPTPINRLCEAHQVRSALARPDMSSISRNLT